MKSTNHEYSLLTILKDENDMLKRQLSRAEDMIIEDGKWRCRLQAENRRLVAEIERLAAHQAKPSESGAEAGEER